MSFGESWHHNHHAFPRSAHHGLHWYELDIAALVIRGLAAVGLASDVVTVDPQQQRERRAREGNGASKLRPAGQLGAAVDTVPSRPPG